MKIVEVSSSRYHRSLELVFRADDVDEGLFEDLQSLWLGFLVGIQDATREFEDSNKEDGDLSTWDIGVSTIRRYAAGGRLVPGEDPLWTNLVNSGALPPIEPFNSTDVLEASEVGFLSSEDAAVLVAELERLEAVEEADRNRRVDSLAIPDPYDLPADVHDTEEEPEVHIPPVEYVPPAIGHIATLKTRLATLPSHSPAASIVSDAYDADLGPEESRG